MYLFFLDIFIEESFFLMCVLEKVLTYGYIFACRRFPFVHPCHFSLGSFDVGLSISCGIVSRSRCTCLWEYCYYMCLVYVHPFWRS